MKIILTLILLLPISGQAIELIIGGKTYYIQKFEIKDDGKTINIPYTIHLSEEAFQESQGCQRVTKKEQPSRRRHRSSASVQESKNLNNAKKTHPFKSLMNDLDGQFKSLTDGLRIDKKPRRKRDFR